MFEKDAKNIDGEDYTEIYTFKILMVIYFLPMSNKFYIALLKQVAIYISMIEGKRNCILFGILWSPLETNYSLIEAETWCGYHEKKFVLRLNDYWVRIATSATSMNI